MAWKWLESKLQAPSFFLLFLFLLSFFLFFFFFGRVFRFWCVCVCMSRGLLARGRGFGFVLFFSLSCNIFQDSINAHPLQSLKCHFLFPCIAKPCEILSGFLGPCEGGWPAKQRRKHASLLILQELYNACVYTYIYIYTYHLVNGQYYQALFSSKTQHIFFSLFP